MKSILNTFLIATMAVSFNAEAVLIDGSLGSYETECVDPDVVDQSGVVGGLNIDPILAYTSLDNSGDATEMDWMTAALDHMGDPYDTIWTLEKIEFATNADSDDYWTLLEDGIYTGDLAYATSHYLIKIGPGNVEYNTFLYQNLDSLFQATISLEWLEGFSGFTGNNFDVYRISHISAVPVPAAIWLFGSALLGLAGFSNRRKFV